MEVWIRTEQGQYEQVSMAPEYSVLKSDGSGYFTPQAVSGIRLAVPLGTHPNLHCTVLKHRDQVGEAATSQLRVVKRAWSERTPWEAVHMVDGEEETRWTSGLQEQGIYAQFDLTGPFVIRGVHADTGNCGADYPRNLTVWVSMDGENWTDAGAEAVDPETYLFAPVECAFVKLEVGACGPDVENNWSVFELDLLTDVISSPSNGS